MSTKRFTTFFLTFERILKNIKRIASPVMQSYGLRTLHLSSVLALGRSEEGLSVSELSRECIIDKALSSRILKELNEKGFAEPSGAPGTKNYNKRYVLTPKCREVISDLSVKICDYMKQADQSVSDKELSAFYLILSRLDQNIESLTPQNVSDADL